MVQALHHLAKGAFAQVPHNLILLLETIADAAHQVGIHVIFHTLSTALTALLASRGGSATSPGMAFVTVVGLLTGMVWSPLS